MAEESSTPTHSNRAFKRPFVFLNRKLSAVPTKKMNEALEKEGKIKEISFTKRHTAKEIGRLILASFPALLGVELSRLTFLKSYNKGHCMDVVGNGLMSGADLVDVFSGRTKNKVFFFVESKSESSTATGGPSTSQKSPDKVTVDLTSPRPKGGKSTRAFLTKMARDQNDMDCIITSPESIDHVKDNENNVATDELVMEHGNVLTVEPTIVGNVSEDLSLPLLFAEKEKDCGRLEEVVAVIHDLSKIVSRLPPFLPITLEEMLSQGKEDNAVCLLILVSRNSVAQSYVDFLFDALDRRCKRGKFLFWLADSHSKEGMKVQAKYGVGVDQTTLLVMVPSHIPQCVEIFNETNLDEKKLFEALAQAVMQCQELKDKSETLKNRRALINEQDEEFFQQCAEQNQKEHDEKESKEQGRGKEIAEVKESECAEQNQKEHDEKESKEQGRGKEIAEVKESEQHDAEESSDSDREVKIGRGVRREGENLEDTLEDGNEETKNMPKKNKKKKKKKNKKKNKNQKRKNSGKHLDEPEEKKIKH